MTIWFTSDPHYYHANVITYCDRPYRHANGDPNVEEMNEALVRNWNNVVRPDDTVYCLGDFSLAIRPVELYTPRLMGTKKLVPGNHDWCHPSNKKSKGGKMAGVIAKYEANGWEVLPCQTEFNMEGVARVNMCHLPYKGDSTDDRFQNHRLEDDGRILLCGHVHSHWQTKRTPKGTLMINVGVDVWGLAPVSEDTLKALISSEQKNNSSSLEKS